MARRMVTADSAAHGVAYADNEAVAPPVVAGDLRGRNPLSGTAPVVLRGDVRR